MSSSDRRLLRLPLLRRCVDVCDRHPKGRGQDTSAECGACTPANGSRQDIEVLIVHAKIAFSLGDALGQMTDMPHSSDTIKRLSITRVGMGRLCTPTDRGDGAALASVRAHLIVCGHASPMLAPYDPWCITKEGCAAYASAARSAAPMVSECMEICGITQLKTVVRRRYAISARCAAPQKTVVFATPNVAHHTRNAAR